MTDAELELRDAGPEDFLPADPDPNTGRPRVREQNLLDVELGPTDPAFVVCRVAEVIVPAAPKSAGRSP